MHRARANIRGHAQVAAALRDQILDGRLAPGVKLQSERHLSDQFVTSRVTVRRALRVLEDERLIVRRHGSGTYVAMRPERRIPLMIDFTGSMRDHAPALQRQLLVSRWKPAEAFAAESLQLDEGTEVLYAERVDYLDEQPVAWDQAWIAASFAEGLTPSHLARVDFVETWSRICEFEIAFCRQTVEAVAADANIARQLGLHRNSPVLKSTELYVAPQDCPAGLYVSFYNPAHVCIASHHHWGAARMTSQERKGVRT